jgi:hypothetical protein
MGGEYDGDVIQLSWNPLDSDYCCLAEVGDVDHLLLGKFAINANGEDSQCTA